MHDTRDRSPGRPYQVLFLCTGNSARSIMAEALLNHLGRGRFQAHSAGSHPTGQVHPLAARVLDELGLPLAGLRSKSWHEFATPDSAPLDFVFTVCDQAAGEACPHWPGQPMSAHWGIEDPAAARGDEPTRLRAFDHASLYLKRRIELFLALPLDAIDSLALKHRLDEIGRSP
jgi:arsenate reductase (thioredoxin)